MPRIPAAFGPFEPLRRLGAGGMAETFVAIRRGPGRFEQTVCIKRILPAYEGDSEFVAAFLDEARTSATLRHTNIVQVLDFGVVDESHYLALELIDGVDLRALLHPYNKTAQSALPAEIVALIALDLVQALNHAHGPDPLRPKVAHRDISPSNVLLSKAGEVKLTDFGIARAANHTRRTRTGVLKGKVPYMPPEYIEHGVFDARSDLYSLGVVLYELLTGARPFDGGSDIETVRRILAGECAPFDERGAAEEAPIRGCITRLLARDPADRFQSANALADALPEVSTHRARIRLADMVREHLEASVAQPAPPKSPGIHEAPTVDALESAPTAVAVARPARRATERIEVEIARPQPAHDSARTRTIVRSRRRSPWAFVALGACVIAAAALLFVGARAAGTRALATQVPALPVPELPTTALGTGGVQAQVDVGHPIAPAHADAGVPDSRPDDSAMKTEAPSALLPAQTAVDAAVLTANSEIEAPVRDARLRIVVVPYGDVWIDGEPIGQAPITARVSRGPHSVAVGAGRMDTTREIHAKKGTQPVTFRRNADGSYALE